MTDNIYQVINEQHLRDIIATKNDQLISTMFIDSNMIDSNYIRQTRFKFYDSSLKNPNSFFIYIDLCNFDEDNHNFTKNIKIPKFSIYYRGLEAGTVEGHDFSKYLDLFKKFIDQLNTHPVEYKAIRGTDINELQQNTDIQNMNKLNMNPADNIYKHQATHKHQMEELAQLKNINQSIQMKNKNKHTHT